MACPVFAVQFYFGVYVNHSRVQLTADPLRLPGNDSVYLAANTSFVSVTV